MIAGGLCGCVSFRLSGGRAGQDWPLAKAELAGDVEACQAAGQRRKHARNTQPWQRQPSTAPRIFAASTLTQPTAGGEEAGRPRQAGASSRQERSSPFVVLRDIDQAVSSRPPALCAGRREPPEASSGFRVPDRSHCGDGGGGACVQIRANGADLWSLASAGDVAVASAGPGVSDIEVASVFDPPFESPGFS